MLERCRPTTCTVSDLVVGNAYSFRVFSENLCGLSTSAAVTKELAHIRKAGGSGPGPPPPPPPLRVSHPPRGVPEHLPVHSHAALEPRGARLDKHVEQTPANNGSLGRP